MNGTSHEVDESKDGHSTDVFPGNQGRAGTLDPCPAIHHHLVNTGDPHYWLPPFSFMVWELPRILCCYTGLDSCSMNKFRDNSFKNHLVK